jgi:hypothetical protein
MLALSFASLASSAHAGNPTEPHKTKTRLVTGKDGVAVKSKAADQVVASTSEAKGPGLELSGGTSFNAYVFKNSNRGGKDGKGRGHHFTAEDSRLNFEVFGKTGPELDGLEYSFLIGFTGNTESGKTAAQENRLKFKGRWGTTLLGVHRGVTDFMAVGAFNSIGATGGILGNYKGVVNETTGVINRDDLLGVAKDNTKATYVSPRFMGVQVGYSFTPDGKHSGEADLASYNKLTDGKPALVGQQIHELGLNYKNTLANGLGVGASATSVFGRTQSNRGAGASPQGYNNIKSYALGLTFSYAGFSLGGEYLDNNKTYVAKNTTGANAGKLYTLGTGYSWNKHAVSLGYLHSKKKLGQHKTNATKYGAVKADVYSVTYDYKVAPGLKVYTEAVNFNYKASDKVGHRQWATDTGANAAKGLVENNKGHAVTLGTAISF